MATESELKEKLAQSCRILAQHGLVKGSTGHVSARVPGRDEILMRGRPKGDRGLRFAEPTSMISVGLDGKVIGDTGGVRRVNEVYIHTEVYKARPEVNAVIHAHPPGVLLCTMAGVKIRPIFGGYEPPGMRMAMDGLPLFERSITLHTVEETLPMVQVMGSKDVCLMRAHGIAVAGRSVEEATHKAIVLETLARLNYYASLHGEVPEISDEDKAEWDRRARVAAERGSEREDGGGWAYLLSLLEMPGAVQFDDTGLGFRL
jgi:ribulose-5-phosphate 4-epimerase/fuculose-1-phosphate aldolase